MSSQSDSYDVARELAALRALIKDSSTVQQLLDLAADEADRRSLAQEHSRLMAWRVAAGFGGVALLACGIAGAAIATAMRPAPPPEILVVDRSDGKVEPLISLADFQMAPLEATVRRNINTFVLAHESYSYEQADIVYYTSAAFMSPQLQTAWVKKWDKADPESPPRKYRKDQRVRIKIGPITVLRNMQGTMIGARAGFTKAELVGEVPQGEVTNWIATVSFHWVNQPTNERDRRINDLGMEVTEYTVDRDLGTPKPVTAPAPVQQAGREPGTSPLALVAPRNAPQVTP